MNRKLFPVIFALVFFIPSLSFAADLETPVKDALERLKAGNARYVENKMEAPRRGQERRAETGSSQSPFCTILSCSDSRVPVEVIFDQGIGDIFVIRIAGNVADVDEIGSMEYSIDHLETNSIVVLGHTNCGAVKAAVSEAKLDGNIMHIVDEIMPAAQRAILANPELDEKELLKKAIKENVWQAIEDLFTKSPILAARARSGLLKVVGAIYDIETGKVKWLGEHPDQQQLLE